MLASEEGHTPVLRLLHEKGADRKLTTTVGLHQAHYIIIPVCSLLCYSPILL